MAPATDEPPAFVFTATRVASHGDGSSAAATKAARRRRHTTNFQPFHLSTEVHFLLQGRLLRRAPQQLCFFSTEQACPVISAFSHGAL